MPCLQEVGSYSFIMASSYMYDHLGNTWTPEDLMATTFDATFPLLQIATEKQATQLPLSWNWYIFP